MNHEEMNQGRFWFLSDILIILVQPIPFYDFLLYIHAVKHQKFEDVEFLLSDLLYAFMVVRIIIIFWAASKWSMFTDFNAKRVSHKYDFHANPSFFYKSSLVIRPVTTVLITVFLFIIVVAYVLWVIER